MARGKGEGEIKMREKEDEMVILLNYFDFSNVSCPRLDGSINTYCLSIFYLIYLSL